MSPRKQPASPDHCIFCAIALGAASAAHVYDDDVCIAFLDTRPVFKGHTLLIPRAHIPTLTDADPETTKHLALVTQLLASAVERGLAAQGTFVAENNKISQSVPHLHWHIVPRTKGDGLRGFFWPRTKYDSDEEMEWFASRIRAAIASR